MHHHQMEIQRIQEMQKLSSLYSRRLAESGGFIKRDIKFKDSDKDQSLVGSEAKSESETDYSSVSSDTDTSSDDDSSIYETEISESEVNDLIDDSKKPLHFINEEVLQGTYRGQKMLAAPPRVPLPNYLTSSEPIPEPLGSNYINIKR